MTRAALHFVGANGFGHRVYTPLLERMAQFGVGSHSPPSLSVEGSDLHHEDFSTDWTHAVVRLVSDIEDRRACGGVVGIGHSFGGAILLCAASQRPDLFRGSSVRSGRAVEACFTNLRIESRRERPGRGASFDGSRKSLCSSVEQPARQARYWAWSGCRTCLPRYFSLDSPRRPWLVPRLTVTATNTTFTPCRNRSRRVRPPSFLMEDSPGIFGRSGPTDQRRQAIPPADRRVLTKETYMGQS